MSDSMTLRALETHRSIRWYKPQPIPPADLQRMMAAAVRASTSGSGQLYSFIRVTDAALRRRLADETAHWFNSLNQHFTAGQEYEQRKLLWRRALAQQGFREES